MDAVATRQPPALAMASDFSALDLYSSSILRGERGGPLLLGDKIIDGVCGGVGCCITEVAGAAGSGKTLFCMLLALQCGLGVAHGGAGARTAYICCGEGRFPASRLAQLAADYEQRYGVAQASLMESVSIVQLPNSEEVFDTVLTRIPEMCHSGGVRLVVIDSIAGMFRGEYETKSSGDMAIRTTLLFRFSSELKRIADTYNTRVVIVNQVTDGFRGDASVDKDCVPALGLAWSHCVNKRLLLSRDARRAFSAADGAPLLAGTRSPDDNNNNNNNENEHENENENENNNRDADAESGDEPNSRRRALRRLSLLLSPDDAERSCLFEIRKEGIRGVV